MRAAIFKEYCYSLEVEIAEEEVSTEKGIKEAIVALEERWDAIQAKTWGNMKAAVPSANTTHANTNIRHVRGSSTTNGHGGALRVGVVGGRHRDRS